MGRRRAETPSRKPRTIVADDAGTTPDAPESGAAAPDADDVSARMGLTVLALVLLLAAAVRLIGIDSKSLWGDELWTISASVGRSIHGNLPADTVIDPPIARITRLEDAVPWWQVFTDFDNNLTQPPLYWVALRLWREAFGESDIAARLFSVVLSLVAMVLIYDVGRMLSGRITGLWAAGLMAVATPQVLYALEVRNYTIQLALSLGAAAVLLRIERGGPSWGRLAGLCALILALVLSHYFALGAAIGLGLYALMHLRGRARWKTLGSMLAAGVLFALVWGRSMLVQGPRFRIEQNLWLYDAGAGRGWRALLDGALIPARQITRLDDAWVIAGWLIAILVLAAVLLWRRRPDLHLPLLWLAGTIGLIMALDVGRSSIHLHYIRYTVLSGPGVFLLLAGLLAPCRQYRHILPALACLWCLSALPRVYAEAYEPWWRGGIEDWRVPAAFLEENTQPQDMVIFSALGANEFAARMSLLGISHYMGTIDVPIVLSLAPPDEKLLRDIARRRTRKIWVITYDSPLVRGEGLLPGIRVDNSHQVPWTAIIWETTWPAEAQTPG